jgi:predicted hydrocarbon binding protein
MSPSAGSSIDVQLPLMYVAPHRSLSTSYVRADTLERFDAIRRALAPHGVAIALLYTYRDPADQQYIGILVLDLTDASEAPDVVGAAVAGVGGVVVLDSQAPRPGLAAFEMSRLNAAGTPVVVVARPFLGDTHKRLIESLGDRAASLLFQAGENAGALAASGVPALVGTLGMHLSTELISQRFLDLQVFGWATIVALNVDDQFRGDALLVDDFEATAWHGQATTPVCHWIRGFLTGALSSLTGHALRVDEPECQGKGDAHCRMVFQRS